MQGCSACAAEQPNLPAHAAVLLCGRHSLQIGKRTAAQMEQSKAWWDEQLAIKAAQKAEEEREEQHTADNIR